MTGVGVVMVVSKDHARVELSINRGDEDENKLVFDLFYKSKEKIEENFAAPLILAANGRQRE